MNITESFQINVQEPTPADGRWLRLDASPTEVAIYASGRSGQCDVDGLRKLRAIIDHLLEAETATEASTNAAVAAEFEE